MRCVDTRLMMYRLWICIRLSEFSCFFFQAEDGIRDLVRSRGLGDVYKRQEKDIFFGFFPHFHLERNVSADSAGTQSLWLLPSPVSYTHLTLPTSDLV